MKRSKLNRKKVQNVKFEEKRDMRKSNGGKSCVQGDKLRNEIKRGVTSGQDPTNLSFQFMERN